MKYKLYRKDFQMWKNYIAILPYIMISINNREFNGENFQITFGWIVWHGRFLFVKRKPEF